MTQTVDNRVFVDTNILVYSSLAQFPEHEQANRRMSELLTQNNEIWISRQVLREYLVTMTRPTIVSGSITLEEVLHNVSIFTAAFHVADETREVTTRLLSLLRQVKVLGSQIYDANIVATMQAHGLVRLLTHNTADFIRYNAFVTVLPLIEQQP
jgi:predicted nucleic acid-binding protein